ncbi:hypothethical protein [Ralstonia solanacearum PSI07]|nr:hypothethical protein [Ralstonia solanacearum PSI07]
MNHGIPHIPIFIINFEVNTTNNQIFWLFHFWGLSEQGPASGNVAPISCTIAILIVATALHIFLILVSRLPFPRNSDNFSGNSDSKLINPAITTCGSALLGLLCIAWLVSEYLGAAHSKLQRIDIADRVASNICVHALTS